MSLVDRLARCDQEIAAAIAASQEDRPPKERIGVLLWEMDWRAERESILAQSAGREPKQISPA
jgi:hypothetical protein